MFKLELSREIYEQTYRFGEDGKIEDSLWRIAWALAEPEEDRKYWAKKFYSILEHFTFVPGGRIISNAGTELDGTTMINCFVDGFMGKDQDSMNSIMDTLKRQALILKSEGGYGFCADVMRPKGAYINGIGGMSPGAVRMLDMWNTQSITITRGADVESDRKDVKKKIRKGAQMVTMSIWHPSIEEFITSKQEEGRLEKFNMSVLVGDAFMDAVKCDLDWDLIFPDHEAQPELYKEEWNGDLDKWESVGGKFKIYKTVKARELWDTIMTSTYNRNEPGVLFVDTMNRLNNLSYIEYINATNPCGEQILPIGGVCLLGSLNITQFITAEGYIDYDKLKRVIPIAVRMLDNVNDISNVPLESQKENMLNKRRIGLGVMGLGSALMMMCEKYGSDRSTMIVDKLTDIIKNKAYQASALLAREKGTFPLYNHDEYMKNPMIQGLSEHTRSIVANYGLRNSHLLSIQPTGNTSILANGVSGGLEPVFMHGYVRTSEQPYAPEGLSIPTNINWESKDYLGISTDSSIWEFVNEGDETLLKTTFEGKIWKYHKTRGLLKEELVEDYAVAWHKERGTWNPDAEWAATTEELTVQEHLNIMEVCSKHIDSAMSKTINLPNDYPYEDFKELYMNMYKTGTIKGGTTYRAGTMSTVLASISNGLKLKKYDAPKRPESLPAYVRGLTAKGVKWIVLVGLYEDEPYEVFAIKAPNDINIYKIENEGFIVKNKSGYKAVFGDNPDYWAHVELDEQGTDEEQAITRLVSTALRHGADIKFIVKQLDKCDGDIVSFTKAISRTLKYFVKAESNEDVMDDCPNNGKDCIIVREEGCLTCKTCGNSRCT